jgi:hypothetical protein
MKASMRVALAGLAALVIFFLAVNQSGVQAQSKEEGTKWEYRVIQGSDVSESMLNSLGKEGWEFVAVYQQNEGAFRSILKRPTP